MKVKYTQPSEITNDDLDNFKSSLKDTKLKFLTGLDVGMDKRIACINLDEDKQLILVNPTIKIASEGMVVYPEMDSVKPKRVRKTLRHVQMIITTDNLGDVEFRADNTDWKSLDNLLNDSGLFECIMVQRMMDALDGIDVTSPKRRYNPAFKSDGKERNERVMVQSPDGQTLFIKRKKAKPYMDKGYKVL